MVSAWFMEYELVLYLTVSDYGHSSYKRETGSILGVMLFKTHMIYLYKLEMKIKICVKTTIAHQCEGHKTTCLPNWVSEERV